jgi:Tol biopolymer transport system component
MDDLHGRFRRLDRVGAPNLWNEAVARSVELELAPRRTFNPGMGLIAVALLLAALAGTLAVGAWLNRPSPVRETVTYENGMIAAYGGCGQITAIDPASFETREIAAGSDCQEDLWAQRPAWSSDGSRLAYLVPATSEGEDGRAGIWLYEAATEEARQIDACRDGSCSWIDISPDGSLVAYVTDSGDGRSALAIAEVDSGEVQRIALDSQPRNPRFSPDGSHITLPMIGGRSGIYLIDIRGLEDGHLGSPTLLYGIIDAEGVEWSPDGQWLAYVQSGGLDIPDDAEPFNGPIGHSGNAIVVARADGSESRVLASGPAGTGPWFPTWSPDSGSVAYVTTPNQRTGSDRWMLELWTVTVDGGEPTRIYESGCCKEGFGLPDWSPDGEWIAFGVDMPADPSRSGTFFVRPDGSDVRHASDVMLDPVWQPIPEDSPRD